eukprot:6189297-Pleurochrysis_carterae.AAC.2
MDRYQQANAQQQSRKKPVACRCVTIAPATTRTTLACQPIGQCIKLVPKRAAACNCKGNQSKLKRKPSHFLKTSET